MHIIKTGGRVNPLDCMDGGENVETVIDRLVEFVKLKGRVRVAEAARALGMGAAHVENIARLLEESGLVEVHYTFTGTEISSIRAQKKEERPKTAEKAGTAEAGRTFEKYVRESERVFEFLEEEVLKKLAAAGLLLERLEKEELGEADKKALKNEVAGVIAALNAFENALQKIVRSEKDFRRRINSTNRRLETVERRRIGVLQRLKSVFARATLATGFRRPAEKPRAGADERKRLLERLNVGRKKAVK